jgi:hypothetical protein
MTGDEIAGLVGEAGWYCTPEANSCRWVVHQYPADLTSRVVASVAVSCPDGVWAVRVEHDQTPEVLRDLASFLEHLWARGVKDTVKALGPLSVFPALREKGWVWTPEHQPTAIRKHGHHGYVALDSQMARAWGHDVRMAVVTVRFVDGPPALFLQFASFVRAALEELEEVGIVSGQPVVEGT